jgi:large subunit ribosomal protein L32
MAVPKKRTGHSAQGKRRSNWKAAKPELTTCPNCGAKALTHTVCTACGTYKGKVVSKKAEGYVEEAKEAVKKEEAAPEVEVKAEEKAEVVEEASEETPEA